MDDTQLALVMQLETAAQASPVADWPHGFAAWVAPLWSQVRAAISSRQIDTTTGATHAH